MTIAAVYVTSEGIVLGADSTASVLVSRGGVPSYHFFNHNQKLLEIGQDGTFGIVTWGLASLDGLSYRTLAARLGDDLLANPAKTPFEVAGRWAAMFFPLYMATVEASERRNELGAKAPFAQPAGASAPSPHMRTQEEEEEFASMEWDFAVGFCIGGYCVPDREPAAFEITFRPADTSPPTPKQIAVGSYKFWGAPNRVHRLISGRDPRLFDDIKACGKWNGTDDELSKILLNRALDHAQLPVRDALDFVHFCIYSTIKGMKFSNDAQISGGPIELAVITTDRNFRWVKHKPWDAAVKEIDHDKEDRAIAARRHS